MTTLFSASSLPAMPPDDRELEALYGRLIEVQWPQLVALCLVNGRSRADAEDIVGEAFVRLYQRHSMVKAPAPYLRQVVINLLKQRPLEQPFQDLETTECSDLLPGLAETEGNELIRQALAQLPDRRRIVFALHLAGQTNGEIARLLDMERATVRSHLRNARGTLQAWWAEEGGPQR